MEHLWEIPEENTVKINVFCVVTQHPNVYGNTKSIGTLMRDEDGGKVWGAMGPFNNFTEEQALMAGIQSACIYAQEKNLQITHIETSHLDVFELIRLQEHVPIPEEQLEAFRLFNTVHANHYVEGLTDRRISWVPEHLNAAARDMGMVIANPEVELLSNLGMGEVVDGSPPPPNRLKRNLSSCYAYVDEATLGNSAFETDYFKGSADAPKNWVMKSPSWVFDLDAAKIAPFKSAASGSGVQGKGKGKMYEDYAFYDNGNLSRKAVTILDSGSLLHFSDVFGNPILDLEAHVGSGLCAKDILHYAVLDSLSIFEPMLEDKRPFLADMMMSWKELELMPVNSVLSSMGFDESVPNPPPKKLCRAASV
ncbi:hypothetical protein ACET3Z_025086 [Daucus carota]